VNATKQNPSASFAILNTNTQHVKLAVIVMSPQNSQAGTLRQDSSLSRENQALPRSLMYRHIYLKTFPSKCFSCGKRRISLKEMPGMKVSLPGTPTTTEAGAFTKPTGTQTLLIHTHI
jgi:hypothetical protein